jgi:hypothetical protein
MKPNEILDVLKHWNKKMKIGSVLKLNFLDVRAVAANIHAGDLSLQDSHNLLFGINYDHKSVIDTQVIESVVKDIGFNIDIISIKDFFVTLEITKISDVKN